MEKAIPLMEKIAATDNDIFTFNNQFILAMAYHKTGKAGLASECLEKGDAELASYIQFRQESWIGLNGMVLQKEAHELLGIPLRNLESDAPAQSP